MPDFEIIERRVLRIEDPYVTERMVRQVTIPKHLNAGEDFVSTFLPENGDPRTTRCMVAKVNEVSVRKMTF